jgi:Ca2+-binding RTX toxin-like protein
MGGDILLGGTGSDVLEGKLGDDLIDGDRWLNVQLRAVMNDGTSSSWITRPISSTTCSRIRSGSTRATSRS